MRKTSRSGKRSRMWGVESARARQIVTEGLLDDQTAPASGRGPGGDAADDLGHGGRRHGKVEDAIAKGAVLGLEPAQRVADRAAVGLVGLLGRDVAHARGESTPYVLVELEAAVLLHGFAHLRAEGRVRYLSPADAEHRERLWQQAVVRKRIEAWQEFSVRKVARSPEDDDRAWVGRASARQAFEQRVRLLEGLEQRRARAHPTSSSHVMRAARRPRSTSASKSPCA